ncbi:MAG: flagellar basal body rod protein FlgC [Rhizobiales bacterium]|nr:flagellar basal body rod protein FlgC [Hyphomicrobiales bacterium]
MYDPLRAASNVAASGLFAQSLRLRVVAENVANAQSTGKSPGADPYRRKTIAFSQELDAATGANLVTVTRVGRDPSSFPVEKRPGHPAADTSGTVKLPNVNMIIEMADMREATRSYEANLQVIKQSREMANAMIDLLRSTS